MKSHAQRTVFTLLTAVGLALGGCQGKNVEQAGPSPSDMLAQTTPIEIVSQSTGNAQALAEPTVKLVKNQQQLDMLGLEVPQSANLSEHDLVVHALGQQNTGGYWVRIKAIQKVGNRLYVQSTINKPGADQTVSQAVTYPYAVAVIPQTEATSVTIDPTTVTGQSPSDM
jgi:hypothetical protein